MFTGDVRRCEQRFQLSCVLPGAVQQVPEGCGRNWHKHCDRYLLYPGLQQLGCLHDMQMGTPFKEERTNALALAGQTLTAMGKGPAKEKPNPSEWVVRGRTRNIFQRGKCGRQTLLAGNRSAPSASVNNRWGCAAAHLLREQWISSLPSSLLWTEFMKHFICGKLLRGTEGIY